MCYNTDGCICRCYFVTSVMESVTCTVYTLPCTPYRQGHGCVHIVIRSFASMTNFPVPTSLPPSQKRLVVKLKVLLFEAEAAKLRHKASKDKMRRRVDRYSIAEVTHHFMVHVLL